MYLSIIDILLHILLYVTTIRYYKLYHNKYLANNWDIQSMTYNVQQLVRTLLSWQDYQHLFKFLLCIISDFLYILIYIKRF